jgi:hypothetical protein
MHWFARRRAGREDRTSANPYDEEGTLQTILLATMMEASDGSQRNLHS